jgi:RNA polymerase sigma factor for flagellar operon FliA
MYAITPSQSPNAHDLVARTMPQVRRIAHKLARRLPRHITIDDLIAAGNLGLVRACANFDPARGDAFAGYAETRIRGAMIDELRSADSLSRDQRAFANRLGTARSALRQRLGREPTAEEVAAQLGIPLGEYWSRIADTQRGATIELDADRDDPLEVHDGRAALADERLVDEEARRAALAALRVLPERLRQIVDLHYFEELTLRQIGDRLGVSESRICQLLTEATRRVRAECAPDATTLPARRRASGSRRRPATSRALPTTLPCAA